LKERITGMSFPEGGTGGVIGYDDLRYVRILYYDFEGTVHKGELIVHRKLAKEVVKIFLALYEAEYPLESVRLVDDFGEPGDDNRSMAANNTSAFNFRRVTGSKTLSRHSYGAAIDINPRLNPYIDGDRVAPENGTKYADRSLRLRGMIDHDDLCYQVFSSYGWSWGGDWKGDKDYQHFSKNVG
ncbi:M15 family metallopeptidase, partial [Christensenellaceae bacterium OttesenSCG-928-L17]|nr:M15 family metallopeptidase [Christensenellaceae bacterium OttesenSCG-928-L17]